MDHTHQGFFYIYKIIIYCLNFMACDTSCTVSLSCAFGSLHPCQKTLPDQIGILSSWTLFMEGKNLEHIWNQRGGSSLHTHRKLSYIRLYRETLIRGYNKKSLTAIRLIAKLLLDCWIESLKTDRIFGAKKMINKGWKPKSVEH